MTYQALYRKYRPRYFKDVIGQEHVVRTLLNSICQDKVGHAYLFSGPRGTGKTTVARILARAINCGHTTAGEPCDECDRCKGTQEGLGVLEIDAASHGSVDDMRTLVAQVSQLPLSGGMMVYIIDEVHMLSKEAFNAFLKTLEEPPPHAVFVLATTEPGKLLPTIHSRCQHFSFRRIPIEVVSKHIRGICEKESVAAEDSALRLIARAGEGSVRDSISILEQAVAFEPDALTLAGVREVLGIPDRLDIRRLAGFIVSNDPGGVSASFEQLIEQGREPNVILIDLLMHFRDLLFATLNLQNSDLETLPREEITVVTDQAAKLNVGLVHSAIGFLAECEGKIKFEEEAALVLEASLLRLSALLETGSAGEIETSDFPAKPRAKSPARPAARQEPVPTETGTFPPPLEQKEPPKPSGPPGLVGGLTLKKKKTETEPVPSPAGTELELKAREGLDPFWMNALESVREASIHEYILLAEAEPSPPPSEWPPSDKASPVPLNLTLSYPQEYGLTAKLVREPVLTNRLSSRLSEVLERPVKLKISRSLDASGEPSEHGPLNPQLGTSDNPGTNDLFSGAGRPVPTDSDLRQIHNLIVEDFPEYRVEHDSSA